VLDPVPPRPDHAAVGSGHRLVVVAGPDAGHTMPLGRAPVCVGRASECDLTLSDPRVSRRHAEVTLGARGAIVHDCGSATGTEIDGASVGAGSAPLPTDGYLRVGDSFVCVRTGTSTAARSSPAAVTELTAPSRPTARGRTPVRWLPALLPAALGVGLALAMHVTEFLLFALLSPVAVLGTSLADRLHHGRSRRTADRDYRRGMAALGQRIRTELAREQRTRRSAAPDPAVIEGRTRLGRRSHRPSGGLAPLRVGLADQPSRLRLREGTSVRPAGTARAVPLLLDVSRGPVGLSGPRSVTLGAGRWLVSQLAVGTPASGVEFLFLLDADTEPEWRWARWLPHLPRPPALSREQHRAVIGELTALRAQRAADNPQRAAWTGMWLVLVLDGCARGEQLPGLPQLLRDGMHVGITAIMLERRAGSLLQECATVAGVDDETGNTFTVRCGDEAHTAVADRVTRAWSERVARELAGAPTDRAGSLPDRCALTELLGLDEPTPQQILDRWSPPSSGLRFSLGIGTDGPVEVDLVSDGPHTLIAGTTGCGKSELLRTLVAGLAANYPPGDVGFVLIDYKGGSAFAECAELPHTLGLVTDLDPHLAERALSSLECELRRREGLFAAAGVRDLDDYRSGAPRETVARLVIVVDEFAELAGALPEFVSGLVGVARRGRSLGVHLVLATQRPAGVVSAEIRANTALRIALRVTDPADSADVIDAPVAVGIDRRHPGRAYLRTAGGTPVLLQTALAGEPATTARTVEIKQLDHWRRIRSNDPTAAAQNALHDLVRVLRRAAQRRGGPAPHRPWLAPLPVSLSSEMLSDPPSHEEIPIGALDLPAQQAQLTLTVDLSAARGAASILFAGGPRSGRSTALRTLAVSAAQRMSPERLHLHVIDHAGGVLAGLSRLPHCGSLLTDDATATARLLARLGAEVARRRALGERALADEPALVLLLDGWEAFVAAAEEHATDAIESLLSLLRTGASAGLTVAIAGDRATLAARLCSAVHTKLALRLTDRGDYALLGLAERTVPRAMPPGRAVRAEDGAEVQLAHLGTVPSTDEQTTAIDALVTPSSTARDRRCAPIRVRPLPRSVHLNDLISGCHGDVQPNGPVSAAVVLGVGGDGADVLQVDLFAGRARLLVAGPPGCGRSTLLASMHRQLIDRGQDVVVAGPARSPVIRAAAQLGAPTFTPETAQPPAAREGATVVLVDDSEALLDTAGGAALVTWLESRPHEAPTAVVVTGVSDEIAVTFRGIAAAVRRARCAVLLDPGPGDGDLVGLRLPIRRGAGTPGRGVVVGDPAWGPPFGSGPVPIQVALP
jgi:S-DNA-T family DNA segregation ATPase FtsK/SpoIIIE